MAYHACLVQSKFDLKGKSMAQRLPKPTVAKTREQVADEYGISERTLRRRLKKENIVLPKGNIMPKDQLRIYESLGPPPDGPGHAR